MPKQKPKLTIEDIIRLKAKGKQRAPREVVMLIEYRIGLGDMLSLDFESEVMESLRQYGAATILDADVVTVSRRRRS